MKATIVNLRYKMKDILKALDRRERVSILYHGKVKGIIVPVDEETSQRVHDHPFFGMLSDAKGSVKEIMDDLRGPRYE